MREFRSDKISDPAMERVMSPSEQSVQQLTAIYKQQNPPGRRSDDGGGEEEFSHLGGRS